MIRKSVIIVFIIIFLLYLNNIFKYSNFHTYYYNDTNSQMTFNDIKKVRFKNISSNNFSLGYNKGNVWLKFFVSKPHERLLVSLNEYHYNKASIYYYNKSNELIKYSGKYIFEINNLKPNGYVYLKLNGNYSFIGNINIYTHKEFYLNSIIDYHVLALRIICIFALIAISSLIFFIKVRNNILLVFSLLNISYGLYLIYNSSLYVYLNLIEYKDFFCTSSLLCIIFSLVFSSLYLGVKKIPSINRVYNSYIVILIFIYVYSFFNIYASKFYALLGLIALGIIVFSSFLMQKKFNNKIYISYFIWVNIIVFIMLVFYQLLLIGILNYTLINRCGLILALFLKALILTYLVIVYIFDKKDSYNKLAIKKALKEKSFYYSRSKELSHRIKNDFHFLTSMLYLQSKNNKNLDDFYLSFASKINSISLLHEKLNYYSKGFDNNERASLGEYINTILNTIINLHNIDKNKKIKCFVDVNMKLKYPYSQYLGIIINELVMNSLKHNESLKNLEIIITLTEKANHIIELEIKDNGKGFDVNKKTNTLGLKIVNDFCSKFDESFWEITSNKNVTKFKFKFKNNKEFNE